ncbi:hypothetical protein D3C84_1174930 [compost metagenome]
MTVHGAFGADGCRGAELDQLDHRIIQWAGMPHRRAQGLHGGQVIRVLLFQLSVGVVLFFLTHLCLLASLFGPLCPASIGETCAFQQ